MLVLGIDCSTVKVGLAVLDSQRHIFLSEFLKLDNSISLESRALVFEARLSEILRQYKIEKIGIESPLILFKGAGGQAQTVALLQRFNGMICYVIRKTSGQDAIPINAISARKSAGIPIVKKRGKSMIERKRPIIEAVEKMFEDTLTPFEYKKTRFGNAAEGADDRADAIVVAMKLLTTVVD